MAEQLLNKDIDLPTFKILTESKAIKDYYQVISIRVEKDINRINSAEIVLLDGSPSEENFEISESKDFVPGNAIEINLGYHSLEKTVFQGIILSQCLKVRSSSCGVRSLLTIKCSGEAIKLTVGKKSRNFKDMKDSEVINSIIGETGVNKKVTATSFTHKKLVQFDSTDWDFILSRAEMNGFVVIEDNGQLVINEPQLSGSASQTITYGKEVIDFQADLDARYQLASVECFSWDGSQQKVLSGNSTEPSVNDQSDLSGKKLASVLGLDKWTMSTTVPEDASVLKSWANARLLKSRLAKLKGYVEVPGTSTITLGDIITLDGFGARFNGKAYVSKIEHTLERGSWTTRIGFGLNDQWFCDTHNISSPSASGLLPGISGLQIGVVKQINEDPDGEFRVLVNVPVIEESGTGVWARLANFYASEGIGGYFYPEINDEVVLGFLNEDPRFPVILGTLYGKKKQPAYTPDDKNSIKGLVTKSEMKLTFNEEKKEIILETPGGNIITISDDAKAITMKDQNNNKVELSDNGILLDSPKDVTIKAGGKFKVKATSNAEIEATGDAKLNGNNINMKAQTNLNAQSAGLATFKASTKTTIKGAMVMIN